MQIEWMSVLRGTDLRHEALERRPRVVRAGRRLGMELQRARAQLGEREALDGLVVERDVRDAGAVGAGDREAVVLARHEHLPRPPILDGMVRASVAERQLERAPARRLGEHLVSEADPEDGRAAEQLLQRLRLLDERLRVARAW